MENSPEWQDMEKSLKEALAKFDKNETKEVVDVPLIKGLNAVTLHLFILHIFLTATDQKCIVMPTITLLGKLSWAFRPLESICLLQFQNLYSRAIIIRNTFI